MSNWLELEQRFLEMVQPMRGARVDRQWGAEGEYWRLAAWNDLESKKRFEALAEIAGQKLSEVDLSNEENCAEITQENDFVIRWYRAIWSISQRFETNMPSQALDKEGNSLGYIYTGSIKNIIEASATFCLELSTRPHIYTVSPSRDTYYSFWPTYGRPILIGLVVTVIGGTILAILF